MARTQLLLINVLIVAACGLIYQLVAGALASYILGDAVTQFSIIIGLYLAALGLGSWLSKYARGNLSRVFVDVELVLALIGGFSAPLLFWAYANVSAFQPVLYGTVLVVGTLVGLEIPLLMRILEEKMEFKDVVSKVLAYDYLGALAAAILFPTVFVPRAGLMKTSLIFGLLNAAVALWATHLLAPAFVGGVGRMRVRIVLVMAALIAGLAYADAFAAWIDR